MHKQPLYLPTLILITCSDGCKMNGDHFVINLSNAEPFTSILEVPDDEVRDKKFLIYPNPTSDILHIINNIESISLLDVTFNISDLAGRIIKVGTLDQVGKQSIQVSVIPNGEYIITIYLKDKTVYETFIIQH